MRLTTYIFILRHVCAGIGSLAPVVVFAVNPTDAANPLTVDTIAELLVIVLDAVILIVFPIVVLMIVYTGMLFVTAQGNPGKISAARTALLWTVIGALVVLGSKALALAIEATVEDISAGVYAPAEPSFSYHDSPISGSISLKYA